MKKNGEMTMAVDIMKMKKLQELEKMYIVFGRGTRMPFIMCDEETYNDQVRIYESKEEAMAFCDDLQDKTKDLLMLAEINKPQMLNFYGSLFLIDIDDIIFKPEGEEETVFPLEKLVVRPDFSKHPAMNTNLQLSGLYFMQELARGIPNDDKKELPRLEEEMAANVVRGEFIIPVLLESVSLEDKDAQVMLPRISNQEGKQYQPLFTDVNEFAKFNKGNKYKLNVLKFDNVLNILDESVMGAVINPLGMNLILNKETLKILKKRFE